MCEEKVIHDLNESNYASLIHIILDNGGCIFGGFLRDFIAGDPPNDMDAIIRKEHLPQFEDDMEKLGYVCINEDEVCTYYKQDCIIVEVLVGDEDMKDCRLGPCPQPDYTVNLLALDDDGLYDWMGEHEVEDIIQSIKRKETVAIDPIVERIKKFATKGYTIA